MHLRATGLAAVGIARAAVRLGEQPSRCFVAVNEEGLRGVAGLPYRHVNCAP